MNELTDQDFRTAVVEIATQARDVSKTWARLRAHLDLGPLSERPARLAAVQEAYSRKSWMREKLFSVVAALTGNAIMEQWEDHEMAGIPDLLEAAAKRVGGKNVQGA